MTRFMVTCLLKDKRVLASKSKIFASVPAAIKYGATVSSERTASVIPVVDAEGAAEQAYYEMVEYYPDHVFDLDRAMDFLRTEDSEDKTVTVVFIGNSYAVGYPKSDKGYFTRYFAELLRDGGAE